MEYFESIVDYLLTHLVGVVLSLAKGAIVFFIGWKLAKWIVKVIKRSKAFQKLDDGLETFVASFIEIILKALVIVSVVAIMGVNLSAGVTALASVGLTFGLAFQGALSNFAGGFIILVFRPFKVGDYIDTHADSGTVESIAIFHTKLRTPDNKIVSIPNGTLSNTAIVNYSEKDTRRVDFAFVVDYDTDVAKAKEILEIIANSQPTLLADQPVVCKVSALDNTGVKLILRFWVKSGDYWDTTFAVNEQVNRIFRENGIVIPYPQVTLSSRNNNK